MAEQEAISPETAARRLKRNSGWIVERTRIYRDLRFDSFASALAFLNTTAALAEERGHHPNLCLHEWRFLHIELYSHALGGLSTWDVEMAVEIDRLLAAAPGLAS